MSNEKQVAVTTQSPPVTGSKKRIAACCRVSTQADEQLHSLSAKSDFYEKSLAKAPDAESEKMNVYSILPESELSLTRAPTLSESESVSMSDNTNWDKLYLYKQCQFAALAITNLYGYRRKGSKIIINEDEAIIIKRIYKEFLDGKSYDEISKGLAADEVPTRRNAVWRLGTIHAILTNEKYNSDCRLQITHVPDPVSHTLVQNNGELPQFPVKNCIPAIIEKKQWLVVQELVKKRQAYSQPPSEVYPFRGIVFCGTCGKQCTRYSYRSEGQRMVYFYRCVSYKDHTGFQVPGMTYTRPHNAGYNLNPTPELAAYRETYKKPISRPFCCSDRKIRVERFPKAFIQAWNLFISKKQRYLPSLQKTVFTSDNPLTVYRAKEMIEMFETIGRIDEFDFRLMMRTLDWVEIMPTEKLSFIFQSGIRITI